MCLFKILFCDKLNNEKKMFIYKHLSNDMSSSKPMIKIILGVFFVICSSKSFGQSSVNTSGSNKSNGYSSISYSIGQLACQSFSNNDGEISQGVQQTFQISKLNLEEKEFNFLLNVYPNPTQENLNLIIGNYHNESFTYLILDTEGKIIKNAKVQSKESVIEIQQLPNATYYVDVHHSGEKVQSFKIIKSN
jgi:hypothetical protein